MNIAGERKTRFKREPQRRETEPNDPIRTVRYSLGSRTSRNQLKWFTKVDRVSSVDSASSSDENKHSGRVLAWLNVHSFHVMLDLPNLSEFFNNGLTSHELRSLERHHWLGWLLKAKEVQCECEEWTFVSSLWKAGVRVRHFNTHVKPRQLRRIRCECPVKMLHERFRHFFSRHDSKKRLKQSRMYERNRQKRFVVFGWHDTNDTNDAVRGNFTRCETGKAACPSFAMSGCLS